MNQEEAITTLHDMIVRIAYENGLESYGISISANRSALFVYVTHRWQQKMLAAILPETLANFTVIVKYRGHSGRAQLIDLAPKEPT